jgi:hypothetical protein
MNNRLMNAILVGFLGAIIGLVMGIAAFGGAVNAAIVFGPVGFIIGWLLPVSALEKATPRETAPIDKKVDPVPSSEGDFHSVETAINEIIPLLARILVSVWNMQIKLLIALGLMDSFVKRSWLLFALAVVLLAVFYPLGVVFSVTGITAMSYGAKPENRFIVNTQKSI